MCGKPGAISQRDEHSKDTDVTAYAIMIPHDTPPVKGISA
jgi:hypothetical protein